MENNNGLGVFESLTRLPLLEFISSRNSFVMGAPFAHWKNEDSWESNDEENRGKDAQWPYEIRIM